MDGGKNAVAAWAGHLGKKNGNSKPCADLGGGCFFFNVGQPETVGGLSLTISDVRCFYI